ncbi:MAG: polysaccharide biosynthesis/export family protein [Ignavibacteriota bacterium]
MKRSLLLKSVVWAAAIVVSANVARPQTSATQQTATAQSDRPPVSLTPAMPLTNPPADAAKMGAVPAGKAQAPNIDVDTFLLGVEDQISVTMWDEPKFNGNYTIRPDGKINIPLIGEIKAVGLTPMELQDAIDKAALTQLKTPRCTVNVIAVHSKRVYFDGDGITPGAMDLVIPTRLLEAISAKGGFRDFADKKHIRILRGGKLFMTINYKDLTSGKRPELNVLLQDKDHVVVN